MTDAEKNVILEEYIGNDAKKLQKFIYPLLQKVGGIYQQDYDDFLSRSCEILWSLLDKYDDSIGIPFHKYLESCLRKRFITWGMRDTNRQKRKNQIKTKDENGKDVIEIIHDVSIDAPLSEDSDSTFGDTIESDFKLDEDTSSGVDEYMNSLTGIQRTIVEMTLDGYSPSDIKKELNLSDQSYNDSWKILSSYEKKRIIHRDDNSQEDFKMSEPVITNDVAETYKNTSYSIESISKQLQKRRIRDDHILQRYSGMWAGFAKSALISDILRGKSLTQIIISEEIKNGLRMQWLIDGKQRCTTLDDYMHDGFPISKNVKNYNIRYQTTKIDESGYEVVNDEGFTEMEYKEFDIRGKRFSQLPEELQDIFKDRQIPVLYNMNCTKKDIAEDIARFNRSRPMNKAQNGWLGLEEGFAELVDNISKMSFFQPDFKGSKYTSNDLSSSGIRRIIVESIMCADFIDDFGKYDKMCEFLSEEASDTNFTDFYSLIERLIVVADDRVSELFTAKDSFLWLGLFSRFANLGIDDIKFIDFMEEFTKCLSVKEVNGVSYRDMCYDKETGKSKPTKDKTIVIQKIEIMESLLMEYLHINKTDNSTEQESELDFVKENISKDVTDLDIEFYGDMLNDYILSVDNNTKLLNLANHKSLVGIVAYACSNDIDLDEWFIDYFNRNNTYDLDQKQNYIKMREDLEKYIVTNQISA
ncbi:MAG: hypothetical protein WCR36_07405 [Bacteroidaceae bacterium]